MLIKDAARADADEIRLEHWGDELPVDPFDIARRLGIDVQVTELRPNMSGAIIAEGDNVKIFIQEADNFGRQTFTCAHEIGHFRERQKQGDTEYSFVENRIPTEELQKKHRGKLDLKEFYADEFSANLLMPEEIFRREIETHGSDFLAAATFGVNPAAVRLRRKRLGV